MVPAKLKRLVTVRDKPTKKNQAREGKKVPGGEDGGEKGKKRKIEWEMGYAGGREQRGEGSRRRGWREGGGKGEEAVRRGFLPPPTPDSESSIRNPMSEIVVITSKNKIRKFFKGLKHIKFLNKLHLIIVLYMISCYR